MIKLKLFNKNKDAKSQDKFYRNVTLNEVTPEELYSSKFPDTSLISIWVEFTSKSEKHYQAVHVYKPVKGSYILLCGIDKDEKDFVDVEKIVANITSGKPENQITDRGMDICDLVNLRKNPTQSMVVGFVEEYGKYFDDISIPVAYFQEIPISVYENSGLPLEKLTCNAK